MTTLTPSALYLGGQLTNAASILVTGQPSTTATIVSAATFTNTDTVPHTLTVYVVRSGGSPGPANILIDALPLPINPPYVSQELQGVTLAPGDTIQALADTSAKMTCSGIYGFVVT